jgi:hypothetical protein
MRPETNLFPVPTLALGGGIAPYSPVETPISSTGTLIDARLAVAFDE